MSKAKVEIKVGDYVRVSRASKIISADYKFGAVCRVINLTDPNSKTLLLEGPWIKSGVKIQFHVKKIHMKYAKQANKKARMAGAEN